jgi:hypothetical protein
MSAECADSTTIAVCSVLLGVCLQRPLPAGGGSPTLRLFETQVHSESFRNLRWYCLECCEVSGNCCEDGDPGAWLQVPCLCKVARRSAVWGPLLLVLSLTQTVSAKCTYSQGGMNVTTPVRPPPWLLPTTDSVMTGYPSQVLMSCFSSQTGWIRRVSGCLCYAACAPSRYHQMPCSV